MVRRLWFGVLATLSGVFREPGKRRRIVRPQRPVHRYHHPADLARSARLRRQPVLFVHGHASDRRRIRITGRISGRTPMTISVWRSSIDVAQENARRSHQQRPRRGGLLHPLRRPVALDHRRCLRYRPSGRLHRPAPQRKFDPATAAMPPPVQVAIIGYSKGTLSSRQYLKSLQVQVQDNGGISMRAPRPGYRPVSEFIAIAPPNHGISSSFFSEATDQISIQQLYNGVQPEGDGCGTPFPNLFPQAANFIEILNGETAIDGQVSNAGAAAGEAPRSRPPSGGPHSGTLYVTICRQPRSCRRRQSIHD